MAKPDERHRKREREKTDHGPEDQPDEPRVETGEESLEVAIGSAGRNRFTHRATDQDPAQVLQCVDQGEGKQESEREAPKSR